MVSRAFWWLEIVSVSQVRPQVVAGWPGGAGATSSCQVSRAAGGRREGG